MPLCCVDCFCYEGIKREICRHNTVGDCDYCGTKNVRVATVDQLGEFICRCLEKKYEDAAESVAYESAEGGYLLPTFDIEELLIDELMIFNECVKDQRVLLEDLVRNDGTPYVRIDPYGEESGGEDLMHTWEVFSKAVMTNRRYTVFLMPKSDYESYEHLPTFLSDITNQLGKKHIVSLDKGTVIYRARVKSRKWTPSHKALTSPPKKLTVNNRMSPKGVSFFYGARDEETAIAESRAETCSDVAVASFEVLRPLTVIDLGSEVKIHNIFDDEYEFNWDEFYAPFLKRFVESISKPLGPNDPQIDYLPTQVLTEYLRFHPKYQFDGILYRSAQRRGGVNLVLFKEDNISTDDKADKDAWLFYCDMKIGKGSNVKEILHKIGTTLSDMFRGAPTLW